MKRKPAASDGRPGWGQRIATLLFSALFMLAFGAGGLAGGLVPMAMTGWRALEVLGWQPVSAQVIETRLDTSRGSKGGATYAVRARYAYRVNGRDFEGQRVGLLDWGYDNIGDWHHDWHARLDDARQREQPVAAWFDPQRPERALLDRGVRWGLMAFHLPFGVLFTGVAVGAAVVFWRALTGRGGMPGPSSPGPAAAAASPAARGAAAGGQLAQGVRGRLDTGGGELHFPQPWFRGLGVLMLVVALIWLPAVAASRGVLPLLLHAVPATLWMALGLHLASLRWRWRRQGEDLLVERRSWLLTRRWLLTRTELSRIDSELAYTSRTNGGPTVHHHRLLARRADGSRVRLTPALAGPEAQRSVERHLRQAMGLARS